MRYVINWLETKGPDWKVATITNEAGIKYEDVSINRTNKKGEVFPDFDNLLNGGTVNGEYWETPDKTKKYLFPPRVEKPTGQRNFGGGISKLMDKKAENIKEAQERKSESIAYFNSVNSAISLLGRINITGSANGKAGEVYIDNTENLKKNITEWRDWFLAEYDKWNSQPF